MKDEFKGFWGFWRGIFSESDATPSASRWTMYTLALIAGGCLIALTVGVLRSDATKAGMILVALPGIIASLALLFTAPYGTNQAGKIPGVLGALFTKIAGGNGDKNQQPPENS